MEPKIKGTHFDTGKETYGNKLIPERDVRAGGDVADTSAAYGNLPKDIVRRGGIDAFEHPSRESQYAKANFDTAQGAGKPFKPKGRS